MGKKKLIKRGIRIRINKIRWYIEGKLRGKNLNDKESQGKKNEEGERKKVIQICTRG